MEARFRLRIQAPHGCEPLGAHEYPIGWIEGPDYEDQLARYDSLHPHHTLRRLKDMGGGTYVFLPGSECAVRAGGRVGTRGCADNWARKGGEGEGEENLHASNPHRMAVRLNGRGDGTGSSPRAVSVRCGRAGV